MKLRLVLASFLTLVLGSVSQAAILIGSYAVYDGPAWWVDNPPVYSGREAASLVFGGLPTDYAISIDPSTDPLTITNTAWYDGWGEHAGMIFDHDYKLDTGNPGYDDPQGLETARSAYVRDGLIDTVKFRNYVWQLEPGDGAVPEPASIAVWSLLGMVGLGYGWSRKRKQ